MLCKDYQDFASKLASAGNWAWVSHMKPITGEHEISGKIRDFLGVLMRDVSGWIQVNDSLEVEYCIHLDGLWQGVQAYEMPEVYALFEKHGYHGAYAWMAHKMNKNIIPFNASPNSIAKFENAKEDLTRILEELRSYTDKDYEFYIPDKAFLNTEKNHEN